MAHLTCQAHGKRVFVIENPRSVEFAPIADVFHRNVSGSDSVKCYTHLVTIDGDSYRPDDLLDWGTDKYIDDFLSNKHDELIYS